MVNKLALNGSFRFGDHTTICLLLRRTRGAWGLRQIVAAGRYTWDSYLLCQILLAIILFFLTEIAGSYLILCVNALLFKGENMLCSSTLLITHHRKRHVFLPKYTDVKRTSLLLNPCFLSYIWREMIYNQLSFIFSYLQMIMLGPLWVSRLECIVMELFVNQSSALHDP